MSVGCLKEMIIISEEFCPHLMFDTISLGGEDIESDRRHLHKYLYARTFLKSILLMLLQRIVTRKLLRQSIEVYVQTDSDEALE